MNIQLPVEGETGFQMAPMIDIVFLLIIFFMVAANEQRIQQREIDVPIADEASLARDPSDRGIITITAEEEIFLGARETSLEEVTTLARERKAENPRFRILLRVDANVPHRRTREVMAACAEGGVVDIIFTAFQTADP